MLELAPRELDAVLSINTVGFDESIRDEELVPASVLRAAISIVEFLVDVNPGGFRNINDDGSTDLIPLPLDPGSFPAPAGEIRSSGQHPVWTPASPDVHGIESIAEVKLFFIFFCNFFFAFLIVRAIPFRQLLDSSYVFPSASSLFPKPGTFSRIISFGVWVALGTRELAGQIRFVELGGQLR